MRISTSSIIISLLLSTILILVLNVLLNIRKTYTVFRIDFIFTFLTIIELRLLFPFEFVTTLTISSHHLLPVLYKLFQTNLYNSTVKFTSVIYALWIAGFIVFCVRFIRQLHAISNICELSEPVSSDSLSKRLGMVLPSNIEIRTLPQAASPFVGRVLRPVIILPALEMSDQELTYVLQHEIRHIKNRDILYKYVVQALVCLYWWFPFIWAFSKQVDTVLEMRVDFQVTRTISNKGYFEYIHSLINISKRAYNSSGSNSANIAHRKLPLSHFTIIEKTTLEKRIKFLLDGLTIKRTSLFIRLLLLFVPLLMTSIIIEPDYATPSNIAGTKEVSKQKTYILKRGSKYHLYIEGKDMGSFNSLNDPSLKGIPIKKGE